MNGLDLRKKLEQTKMSLAEIARLSGMNPQSLVQSLSTKDVKTGLVEKLASALHLPLSYFYGEDAGTHAIANGDKAVAAVNSTISDTPPEREGSGGTSSVVGEPGAGEGTPHQGL